MPLAGLLALGGLSMFGGLIQSKAQRTQGMLEQMNAGAQSFALQSQANTLDFQSRLMEISGRVNLERESARMRLERGEQAAAVAASGIEMSGSSLQVLGRAAASDELDLIMMRFGIGSKIQSMRFDADNMRLQAGIVGRSGVVAQDLRKVGATTGLLGSFGNALTPIITAQLKGLGGKKDE